MPKLPHRRRRSYQWAACGRSCMVSSRLVTQSDSIDLCLVVIAQAIRARSSTVTGHTTSHSRQYASIIWRESINLVRARRVCPCCNCCRPHEGQVETKIRGFFIRGRPLQSSLSGLVSETLTPFENLRRLPRQAKIIFRAGFSVCANETNRAVLNVDHEYSCS